VSNRRHSVAGSLDALIVEIQAYLSVVDAFRREGCEPCWRLELTRVGKELP
jgi:hypothetical protein